MLVHSQLIISTFYILILCIIKINAENNIIKILINRPDINSEQYLEKQNSLVNQYFLSEDVRKKINLPENFNIIFSYCTPDPNDGEYVMNLYGSWNSSYIIDKEYAKSINCTVRELKNSNYDMLILDERFLFSDKSSIFNIINKSFSPKSFHEYFRKYNMNDINYSNDIGFHDINILKDGYYENNVLYGLPYEFDFDVLYNLEDIDTNIDTDTLFGINNNAKENKNIENIDMDTNINTKLNTDVEANSKSKTGHLFKNLLTIDIKSMGFFNSFIEKLNPEKTNYKRLTQANDTIGIGFGNNDELLNSFIEYSRIYHDIPEKDNEKYFNKFSKDEIYTSFYDSIVKKTGLNITEALNVDIESAYHSFINGENKYFKGKASYYQYFKEFNNITVSIMNLPKNYSVINEKYIVINENSKIKDNNLLQQVALQLTSKKFQLYRANKLGSIPTFDFYKYNDTDSDSDRDKYDEDINNNENDDNNNNNDNGNDNDNDNEDEVYNYCHNHSEICRLLKYLHPIRIKKTLQKNRFCGSFMESRLILPLTLKKSLTEKNYTNIKDAFLSINEPRQFIFYYFNHDMILMILLMIITILVDSMLIVVMVLVYLYKNHPHMKPVSPNLSNITIIGMILNIFYPITYFFVYNDLLCRINFILKFFIGNMILLPIFLIIFRIFYIYSNVSKVQFGKKINDKQLMKYIILILIFALSLTVFIVYYNQVRVATTGSLSKHRYFYCEFYQYYKYGMAYNFYYLIF
eukprot:jgi/Orpsp1_1/1182796/evm.model.c7180000082697.1